MSTPECPRVSLVEALHDGRLGPQERASMERHVAVCSCCAALARDLTRIGDALRVPIEPLTPLEHQRARLELLKRATEPGPRLLDAPRAASSFAPARYALAAAVMALAVVVGWIGGRATAGPSALSTVAFHLPRPPRLAPPRETTLRPSDDARFERGRTAGLDVVTLTSGALDMTVRPLAPGERLVVRTGDAEVEVRGTALRVEADQGRIRRVAAIEGTVEVRYAGFSAVIPSGGSWHATDRATVPVEPAAPAVTPAPAAEPPSPSAPRPVLVAARTASPDDVSTSPVARSRRAAALQTRLASREPQAIPARQRHAVPRPLVYHGATGNRPGLRADEPPSAPGPGSEAPRTILSAASRDFAGAMRALRVGDYDASATQLAAFSASYPGDARADEADYLRAIALQRAGRAPDATATARRYLATRPTGAHRAEAKLIAGQY